MIKYSIVSDVTITDAIRDYIENKLQKVEPLLSPTANSDMKLRLDKVTEGYNFTATLIVEGLRQGLASQTYKASEINKDAYAAIDEVEEKLKRQVRKTLTNINRDSRHKQ